MKSFFRFLKLIGVAILTVLCVVCGVVSYNVMNFNINELVACSDADGDFIIPSKQLCRQYLFHFRGNEEDISLLHRGIGASLILNGMGSIQDKEEVLKNLIGKGLDINRVDRHRLTPMHGAVLSNSLEHVQLLLRNGADASMKDGHFQLDPLGLAYMLQRDDVLKGHGIRASRDPIIALLANAKNKKQP